MEYMKVSEFAEKWGISVRTVRNYCGLQNWKQERGWLVDTVLTAQDRFKAYLDYFRIPYTP